MNQKEILKEMLNDLCPMIYGRWLVGDGAMLGITRNGDLIDHDNDIDIYLLPGSSIKLPKTSKYNIQKYYMNDKFFDSTKPRVKLNKWLDYISYKRLLPENKNLNRFKLISKIKNDYREESIDHQFSTPNIDVFYLTDNPEKKRYEIPVWSETHDYHFKYDEVEIIGANMDLGFMIPLPLPHKCKTICERNYGANWEVLDANFQY
tara:strand:- start:815 stop:1429 length:615 start_codon:yes stop_codon:yes gene_type:complete